LFIPLFYDTAPTPEPTLRQITDERIITMTDESEKTPQEAVVSTFQKLFWYLPGSTEENHVKLSGQWITDQYSHHGPCHIEQHRNSPPGKLRNLSRNEHR
jgi:hypothetical protein